MGVLYGLGGCVHHCFGICAIDCIGSSGSASTSRRGGGVAHVGRRGNERAGVGFRLLGGEGWGRGPARRRTKQGGRLILAAAGRRRPFTDPIDALVLLFASFFDGRSRSRDSGSWAAGPRPRGPRRRRPRRPGSGGGRPVRAPEGGGAPRIAAPARSPANFPRAQDGFQAAAGRCGGREMQEMRLQKPQGMRLWRLRSAKLQLPYMCTKQW